MLLKILKNNRFGGIVFIFLLMMLIWTKPLLVPPELDLGVTMPLYDLLFGAIQKSNVASVIISMAVYAVLASLMIRLNTIHFLLEERSYMPAIFFLLISATFPAALIINPLLISSLFLLLAFLIMIRGEEHRAEPLSLFNATLLIGAGSFFYLKIIWFIPLLWITAAMIRPLKWRGIVNPFIVLLLIALFQFTYYWVFKDDIGLFIDLVRENLNISGNFEGFDKPVWMLLGFLTFLVFISSAQLISRFQVRKIIVRKLYQVFFFMFLYLLVFYAAISRFNVMIMPLLAVPMSFLFSVAFHKKQTFWWHELLIWIWIGLIVYMNIYEFI
ncbi:MAG: hypothetical protein K9J30_06510 [Bacteroidales bacterium]|nr:hypothetical protein [Bacteroidales bacterium]